ncbi:putative sodium-dependent excitatory amino acid transporter glt-3 isoform X2 [Ylistrum balloti]|uniref:putative sodium-dependent excitatory amino acid transporter glt-3 isoform X2 n=1 Tax=Ylistrum balloti TaxID=509963 RepID=UPI002905F55E|nr:putative sodium-dependent excitatory amino acid transporter glt-3 isoform X2 [Ylistrum balloti]
MEMAERRRTRCGQLVRTNGLVLLTLAGVVLGLSSGFGIRELKPTATAIMWIGMIGELYLRVLEMMIVPLIITSIISVTSTMDPKSNGRISAVCLVYTLVCNFVPSVIGCLLCIAVGPGNAVKEKFTTEKHQSNHGTTMDTSDVLADLLRNFFPDNIVEATFLQTQTTYNLEKTSQLEMMLNETSLKDTRLRHMKTVRSPNILGLVMICTLFGIASGVLRDVSKPFQAFFSSASDVIMQVLRWIMWLTPIGVASLITKIICSADNIADDFQKLGMFIVTAAGGMVFCGLVIPVSFFILRRTNPFPFVLSLSQPIMMTFATANTPITMPAVMTILENEHGVDRRSFDNNNIDWSGAYTVVLTDGSNNNHCSPQYTGRICYSSIYFRLVIRSHSISSEFAVSSFCSLVNAGYMWEISSLSSK